LNQYSGDGGAGKVGQSAGENGLHAEAGDLLAAAWHEAAEAAEKDGDGGEFGEAAEGASAVRLSEIVEI
jgi:hypothetical protein